MSAAVERLAARRISASLASPAWSMPHRELLQHGHISRQCTAREHHFAMGPRARPGCKLSISRRRKRRHARRDQGPRNVDIERPAGSQARPPPFTLLEESHHRLLRPVSYAHDKAEMPHITARSPHWPPRPPRKTRCRCSSLGRRGAQMRRYRHC